MRLMLNRVHKQSPDHFLKSLPQEDVKAIRSLEIQSDDLNAIFISPEEFFKQIHYSWLVPIIDNFPKDLHPTLLAALPEPISSGLKKIMDISISPISLAQPVKSFLLFSLYQKFKDKDIIPLTYLPPSPLAPLIELNKPELLNVIDFLGLHDLAEEIRQIVDQKVLKTIYHCLPPKKQKFLRTCLRQKEKLVTPKLGLEKWQGDCKKLEHMLHRRGLLRLGKALSGQHPHFIWHIVHFLDTGRGALLSQYISKEATPGVTPALIQQVINIININKQKSET